MQQAKSNFDSPSLVVRKKSDKRMLVDVGKFVRSVRAMQRKAGHDGGKNKQVTTPKHQTPNKKKGGFSTKEAIEIARRRRENRKGFERHDSLELYRAPDGGEYWTPRAEHPLIEEQYRMRN